MTDPVPESSATPKEPVENNNWSSQSHSFRTCSVCSNRLRRRAGVGQVTVVEVTSPLSQTSYMISTIASSDASHFRFDIAAGSWGGMANYEYEGQIVLYIIFSHLIVVINRELAR